MIVAVKSSPADRPDSKRIFPSKPNFLSLMTDRQVLVSRSVYSTFSISIFDFQQLVTIRHTKAKSCVVLRGATRPEGQCPVIIAHAAKPVHKRHAVSYCLFDIADLRGDDGLNAMTTTMRHP